LLKELNARLVYLLLAAAALLGFALAFLVCADVIGRGAFSRPVKGTPEIVSMSIVIICFLLAGYSVQSRSMIYTDVLVSMFGWRGHVFTALSSGILGAMFFGIVMWGTWDPLMHAFATGEYEGEGALRVPVWPARVAVLAGSALVMLNYIGQAVGAIIMLIRNVPPEEPMAEQAQLV
jgi:TRAP-type C4-dicarboxylate transport system permease small subunit